MCPIYVLKSSKSALAQPLEDKFSNPSQQPSSTVAHNLVVSENAYLQDLNDRGTPVVESEYEASSSSSSSRHEGQPQRLSPGAEFKIEVESIEAINLLESGSPRGLLSKLVQCCRDCNFGVWFSVFF